MANSIYNHQYFEIYVSMLSVIPFLVFVITPKRSEKMWKVLLVISIVVLVVETAFTLMNQGRPGSLIPTVALNYFFSAAAALAIGQSANIEKSEKNTKNLIRSLLANEEKVENLGPKSKMVGALLSFFLGGVGAHRYYLGYKKRGILMSIGCGCLLLGSILLGIGSANAVVSVYPGEGSGGAIVLTILSIPLMLVGTAVGIMALIDFI